MKGEDEEGSEPKLESKAAEEPCNPVVIVGVPGGAFNIRGPGLGNKRGALTVDGFAIPITSWSDRVVRGQLPRGYLSGHVELTLGDGAVRRGVFPPGMQVIR